MERLNWHIAQELARYAEVCVIGPAGSSELGPPGIRIIEVPIRPLWRFLALALLHSWRFSKKWKPDIVLAGSGLTAPIALAVARRHGATSATYTHGLDLAVSHSAYRQLWLPLIARTDVVIVNSRATHKLAESAHVDASRIRLVHPGTEVMTETVENDASAQHDFRQRLALGPGPLLLSVGRLTRRKGLREFVSDVLPSIAARFPNVVLLIIGEVPQHALHAETQTQESIEGVAAQAGVSSNVRFGGVITDRHVLSIAYRTASLHVFPVRHLPDDPEGFGMVAIEAAAHGLATIAYRTGGVPDAVADGVSGILIPPHDSNEFAAAAISILEQPLPARPMIDYAQQFSWERVGLKLAQTLGINT